jgi:phosphoribosylaminoimidazolecarboxamide formyltransferase/IMP cyclohydrolase
MRALISVSDKTGVVEFAKALAALGVEIISTGGTAKSLSDAGLKVIGVSDITGFPECLDGRVKTLHPNIHAGILAMRDHPDHMAQLKKLNVETIDIVVVNLYPFKKTILEPGVELTEAIENIDIGGPTVLRAAAKNYHDVTVVVDAADYDEVIAQLKNGGVTEAFKFRLAAKVFNHTAAYDALIAQYLSPRAGLDTFPEKLTLTYEKVQDMRYGENPHQRAAFYREIGARSGTLVEAKQLWGKELSYNNINDTNGALELLYEFDSIAVVAVKHANPCGVGTGGTIYEAYMKAYEADSVSIFGGIVALNREVDAMTAEHMAGYFLEIIIAPSFSPEALEILEKKKNIRLLKLDMAHAKSEKYQDMKRVMGGMLVQDADDALISGELVTVTKKAPTQNQINDMLFAWKIVKHVKSNAIAIAKDGQSIGVGPGQMNRVGAVRIALETGGDKCQGAALASDAYFPFPDSIEVAAQAGITAIIQPGGSINDQLSIDACDKYGIAIVFTGMRHFKH